PPATSLDRQYADPTPRRYAGRGGWRKPDTRRAVPPGPAPPQPPPAHPDPERDRAGGRRRARRVAGAGALRRPSHRAAPAGPARYRRADPRLRRLDQLAEPARRRPAP